MMVYNSTGIGGHRRHTKEVWQNAYSIMRLVLRNTKSLSPEQVANLPTQISRLAYRCLVSRDRRDPLSYSPEANLEVEKIVNEILRSGS